VNSYAARRVPLSKKTILWLSLIAIGVSLIVYLATIPQIIFGGGGINGGTIFLFILSGVISLPSWIGALIRAAQMRTWGWFILVLLLGSIGSLIYSIYGPPDLPLNVVAPGSITDYVPLAGVPADAANQPDDILLAVSNLKMHFPLTSGLIFQQTHGYVHAIDGVSFAIRRGTTLGLVGESGSGKTTIGRCLVRLYKPTDGAMVLGGIDLSKLYGPYLRQVRRQIQMIFQDPFASLNPRYSIGSLIAEPLRIHGIGTRKQARERTEELLELVGLNPSFYDRYPHEFSGGQRQRIVIARAISINPAFIIADEPVSALDVSIRAQILNLMQRLQRQLGLTYLFISHDLSVVRHVADQIAVMYLGKIMELADRDSIYQSPKHPYTQALLSAVPIPDPKVEKRRKRIILAGDLPSPVNIPSGCRFHTRCPLAQPICREIEPIFEDKTGAGHFAACHFSELVNPPIITRPASVTASPTDSPPLTSW
jgi:oligopeptide transport system ATP-binding protein